MVNDIELITYAGVDKVVSSFEMRDKFKDMPLPPRITSGYTQFDNITGGFSDGNLVVMSGPTKCGKTSYTQSLTQKYSQQGIGCLWFTYEVPPREFLSRFPGGGCPLFYLPQNLKDGTLDWIEKRIKEGKAKYDTKIIFIDHLHFLLQMGSQNTGNMIGMIMRELKKIALRNDVVIFIMCHITKIPPGETPSTNHLRDSSFIGQESDFVLMISRPPMDENDPKSGDDRSAKLRVLENRNTGKRGLINMVYDFNTFTELSK